MFIIFHSFEDEFAWRHLTQHNFQHNFSSILCSSCTGEDVLPCCRCCSTSASKTTTEHAQQANSALPTRPRIRNSWLLYFIQWLVFQCSFCSRKLTNAYSLHNWHLCTCIEIIMSVNFNQTSATDQHEIINIHVYWGCWSCLILSSRINYLGCFIDSGGGEGITTLNLKCRHKIATKLYIQSLQD